MLRYPFILPRSTLLSCKLANHPGPCSERVVCPAHLPARRRVNMNGFVARLLGAWNKSAFFTASLALVPFGSGGKHAFRIFGWCYQW